MNYQLVNVWDEYQLITLIPTIEIALSKGFKGLFFKFLVWEFMVTYNG